MDGYMNDTHSHYYNVDHSSMYGSNLSTVFADGPPPLEDDNGKDHSEFVFSAESNAIGEAVLSKIEGKFLKNSDLGGESEWSDFAEFSLAEGNEEDSNQANNFVPFADLAFPNAGHPDAGHPDAGNELSHGEVIVNLHLPSVNGFSEDGESEDDKENDDDFDDFSSGPVYMTSSDNKLYNLAHRVNDKSTHQTMDKLSLSCDNDMDLELSDKREPTSELNKNQRSQNENRKDKYMEKKLESINNVVKDNFLKTQTESNAKDFDISDNENENFGDFQMPSSNDNSSDIGQRDIQSDYDEIIGQNTCGKTTQKDDFQQLKSTSIGSLGTNSDDDSFGDFSKSNPSFAAKKAFSFEKNFVNFEKDDFGNFTEGFSNEINDQGTKKESSTITSENNMSEEATRIEKTISNVEDNEFGDFSEAFSVQNISSKDNSQAATYLSANNESKGELVMKEVDNYHIQDKSFSTISTNDNYNKSGNQASGIATDQDEDFGDFANFSNSSFGSFSENSESNTLCNPNSGTSGFSWNSSPSSLTPGQSQYKQQIRNANAPNRSTSFLQLLQRSFPKTFVASQSQLDILKDLKLREGIRIGQGKLWTNLHTNSKEGVLRFSWEESKTSDNICKVLDISKERALAQSNIVAMTNELGVPAFATGLGILQPSIVQASPKKTKSKSRKSKEFNSESKTVPVAFMGGQPSGIGSSESRTDSCKDNTSDTASLSDTTSLDLEFFASAPSNASSNVEQGSSNSLFNLDFSVIPAQAGDKSGSTNARKELAHITAGESLPQDPLRILQKLDTTKMSSIIFQENQTNVSPQAKEIIETLDDLSFMHSSVLMFPLPKND